MGKNTPHEPSAFNINIAQREHAEFHNCHTEQSVREDIEFLRIVYGDKLSLSPDDVTVDFVHRLKVISKDIYFFLKNFEIDFTPESYIKSKYEFIRHRIPNGDPHLLYLAWNGLIKNDSFRRLLLQIFSISRFSDILCPQNIPSFGSSMTRYRTKLVLADDMATTPDGKRRTAGRMLDDGSGLIMQESIIWLPNGKAIPIFPQAYVPLNQTHVIMIRHGKSVHESGGDNPSLWVLVTGIHGAATAVFPESEAIFSMTAELQQPGNWVKTLKSPLTSSIKADSLYGPGQRTHPFRCTEVNQKTLNRPPAISFRKPVTQI
jgi:hypothetical protein